MNQVRPAAIITPSDLAPVDKRRSARQRWVMRSFIAAAALIYEVIWVASAFDKINPTDLDVFFWPATHIALMTNPLDIYQLRVGLIYPNANGPLGLIPVYVAAWLAQARGWSGDVMLRRALVFALTAPFPLLIGWEAAALVSRVGGRLRGLARALPYLPVIIAPELWLSALYYGHIEQIIAVWLTLVSLRLLITRRALASGALVGLALLARSDATLIILPIAVTLIARRQFGAAARYALGALGATLAGLTPFLLADSRDTLFSLVTFRSALPVGGGNIWSLSDAPSFIALGQRFDAALALGVALALTLLILVLRRDIKIDSPDVYGLLTVSTLSFALLIKTLWPYYYLEAALFATIWALARSVRPMQERRWRRMSRLELTGALSLAWTPRLLALITALTAEYGLEANDYGGWAPPWSIIVAALNIFTITVASLALVAGPLLAEALMPSVETPPGDILEAALSAPADH